MNSTESVREIQRKPYAKSDALVAPYAYRRPALFALGATCAGIILGQYNFVSHWVWLTIALLTVAVAGFALLGATVSTVRFKVGISFTLLGLLTLLAFRVVYARSGAPPNHILHSVDDGSRYRIYGLITDWPDVREHSTRLTVRVDSTARIVASGRYGKSSPRSGSIMVFIKTQTTYFQYADKIVFEGKLSGVPEKKNPGGFDYARYFRWKDIFAMVYLPHQYGITRNPETNFSIGGATRVVREYILSVFHKVLQEQPAALASGFLIGETAGIDDAIYRQFRRSGTLHLLAVSGSNVAVALLVLRLFLWPFPLRRRIRYLLLILGAVFFSFLSHNDPSVVRASVMVTLFLLGRSFERKIDYHNIIAAAGALILLWNPNQLFDVGFQLSFVVTWALILFLPPIHKLCERWRRALWYKFLMLPLIFAFVAQLSSSPIVLYYFGVAPLNATISNLVIGPAVGAAVALSLVTLAGATLLPLLGAFLGSLLNLWLNGILVALRYFGGSGVWQLRDADYSALSALMGLIFVFLLGVSLTSQRARRLVILSLAVTPIVLLAPRIYSHSFNSIGGGKDFTTTVLASRGGVSAILGGSPPTIIVSDIVDEPKRQFQYVFGPALRLAQARDRVNLVQLSADYGSLINSLAICDSFPLTTLTLTANAKRLWLDYQIQYEIPADKYHLQFSSEIDTEAIGEALRLAPDSAQAASLFVGSSLALQVFGKVRVLYLSATPHDQELKKVTGVFRTLSEDGNLSHSETPLIVVVDKLDGRSSNIFNNLARVINLKIISSRRNHRLQYSADFAQLISYISETGAVRITAP